jgi:pilus assembly protein Flp/PilA
MSHVGSKIAAQVQALWATREQGATAVEYGMLVALVAAVVVAVILTLGSKLNNAFSTVNNVL